MLAPITTLAPFGLPFPAPGPGVIPVGGPISTLAFTLPLAGPVPSLLQGAPQACQDSTPNVQLAVTVVDQDGNPVDLSAATSLQLWVQAPDGTPVPLPAAFGSNGLDGVLVYTTSAEDLTQDGLWRVQAAVGFGATTVTTFWGEFYVGPNIP
jgi:hypothetical protein